MAHEASAGGPGVEVFGENELVQRLGRGEPHFRACISIGNPRRLFRRASPGESLHPLVRSSFERLLRLSFHDLTEAVVGGPPGHRDRLPSRRDAERVVRFYEDTKGWTDGWTVHCWAGVSRSTAVALALLYLITGSEDAAAEALERIRPEAMPNRLLASAFDEVLGSRLVAATERIYLTRADAWGRELKALIAAEEAISGEFGRLEEFEELEPED